MKKIFVADDDFDTLYKLNSWLRGQGFYVRTFSCLQPLFEALDETVPDLILLDINLEGADGRDVCKRIKKQYSEDIFIILSSARPAGHNKEKVAVANGHLLKPFQLQQVSHLLQDCLN